MALYSFRYTPHHEATTVGRRQRVDQCVNFGASPSGHGVRMRAVAVSPQAAKLQKNMLNQDSNKLGLFGRVMGASVLINWSALILTEPDSWDLLLAQALGTATGISVIAMLFSLRSDKAAYISAFALNLMMVLFFSGALE